MEAVTRLNTNNSTNNNNRGCLALCRGLMPVNNHYNIQWLVTPYGAYLHAKRKARWERGKACMAAMSSCRGGLGNSEAWLIMKWYFSVSSTSMLCCSAFHASTAIYTRPVPGPQVF